MAEILTSEIIRRAIEKVRDAPYRPCPHIVHPRYSGRRLAVRSEDVDVVTRCATCFAQIGLTAPLDAVG